MDETLAYADADFSLERLAELVGSNSKYVSQAVNEHYGKKFSSFVTDYRIRLACRCLADDEAYGAYTIEEWGGAWATGRRPPSRQPSAASPG